VFFLAFNSKNSIHICQIKNNKCNAILKCYCTEKVINVFSAEILVRNFVRNIFGPIGDSLNPFLVVASGRGSSISVFSVPNMSRSVLSGFTVESFFDFGFWGRFYETVLGRNLRRKLKKCQLQVCKFLVLWLFSAV
jgi:hypothetical protein